MESEVLEATLKVSEILYMDQMSALGNRLQLSEDFIQLACKEVQLLVTED